MREPTAYADGIAKKIVDAAIEVHRLLGPGYMESVYENALFIELQSRGLKVDRQKRVRVSYKGHDVGEGRMDLVVENSVIIELKAVDALAPIHTAQVIAYLKATGIELGLLINFNVPLLKQGLKRIVYTD
jgi:GxxExxY protein